MRTLEITFRRKFKDAAGNKTNYGNSTEEVTKPGKKEPEIVPCFRLTFDRLPQNPNEFLQDVGGEKNWDKAMEVIYTNGIKSKIQSDIFLKLGEGNPEGTEEGRKDVIQKAERIAREFSYATIIQETLSAKSAMDELNSPEMQELMKSDTVEFAKRVAAILASTRGAKAA